MDTESDPGTATLITEIIVGATAIGGTTAALMQKGPRQPKPPSQQNAEAAAYQQAERMRKRAGRKQKRGMGKGLPLVSLPGITIPFLPVLKFKINKFLP